MTHDTDCRILDEYRHVIEEFANEIWNGGGAVPAHVREVLESEHNWQFLGNGIARATFRVTPETQTGPVENATQGAPCVVKFATAGRGNASGQHQNTEEIEQFEDLPDDLTGEESIGDPDAPTPIFVPIRDYDEAHLWLSMPEVDPNGGSLGEIRERLELAGWHCRDMHNGNVGSMHGESVVMDYGLSCRQVEVVDEVDELTRRLERLDAREIEVIETPRGADVEFWPPESHPAGKAVETASFMMVESKRGDVGVSYMELVFGQWDADDDEQLRKVERGLEQVRAFVRDEFNVVRDVTTRTEDVDRDIHGDDEQVEAFIEVDMGEFVAAPMVAKDIYVEVMDLVSAGVPDPNIGWVAGERHENLDGIAEGDVIDHPEWANFIEVLEIDVEDGVVVVEDSSGEIYDMRFGDNEVELYDWSRFLVEPATEPSPIDSLSVDDVVRVRFKTDVRWGVVLSFTRDAGKVAASVGTRPPTFQSGIVEVGPLADEHDWDTELIENLGQHLTHADLEAGMELDHPKTGRVTIIHSSKGFIEAERGDGKEFDLSKERYQPLARGMVAPGSSPGPGMGGAPPRAVEGVHNVQPGDITIADVERFLNVNNQVIWFDIPSNYDGVGTGTAIAKIEGDVLYKTDEGEEYWTSPKVVAENSLAIVERLTPDKLSAGDIIDNHPALDEPYRIVEVDTQGNITAEPAGLPSPNPDLRVNLRLNEYQPLTANMLVDSDEVDVGPAVPESAEGDIIEVVNLGGQWEVLVNGNSVYQAHGPGRGWDDAIDEANEMWAPGKDKLVVAKPDGREVVFEPDGDVEQQVERFDTLTTSAGTATQAGRAREEREAQQERREQERDRIVEVTENPFVSTGASDKWLVFVDAIRQDEFAEWADAAEMALAIATEDDELRVDFPNGDRAIVEPGEGFMEVEGELAEQI